MNTDYFAGYSNPETVKRLYRKLAQQYHPDLGGNETIMKIINEQYHSKLASFHGQESRGTDGQSRKYYYSFDRENAVIQKLQEVLALRLPDLQADIIGSWLWVFEPEPKKYWDQLQPLGLKYNGKGNRQCWQFHTGTKKRGRYARNKSVNDLRGYYGYRSFESEERQTITR